MLSDEVAEFIARSMKIDLKSLYEKFDEEEIRNHKNELVGAVTEFVQAIVDQNESGVVHDIFSFEDSPAEAIINKRFCDLSDEFSNEDTKAVLDSLRHAFCSFAFGGLHQLYTRQENEVWYPKIVLDEELKPNDIDALPENITLYRGTDFAEFTSKNFGQSWTTSKDVAYDFAFRHYAAQPWFEESERLVLNTKISRKYVYFSNQSCEFEVVIDTSKLTEVRKCT